MAIMRRNYGQPGRRSMPLMQPKPPRPRFRWWIVEVIAACLLGAWAVYTVEPAICWPQILYLLGVTRHGEEYSKLTVLCLAMVGYLLIKRVLGKGKR